MTRPPKTLNELENEPITCSSLVSLMGALGFGGDELETVLWVRQKQYCRSFDPPPLNESHGFLILWGFVHAVDWILSRPLPSIVFRSHSGSLQVFGRRERPFIRVKCDHDDGSVTKKNHWTVQSSDIHRFHTGIKYTIPTFGVWLFNGWVLKIFEIQTFWYSETY